MSFVQYTSYHGIINTARTNASPNRKQGEGSLWLSEGSSGVLSLLMRRFVEAKQSGGGGGGAGEQEEQESRRRRSGWRCVVLLAARRGIFALGRCAYVHVIM
jgi:hypothetical protein